VLLPGQHVPVNDDLSRVLAGHIARMVARTDANEPVGQ